MKRFQQFLDRKVNIESMKNDTELTASGISVRYLPDPPEAFDEIELALDFKGQADAGLMITLVDGKIKKLLLGKFHEEDEDVLLPLDDEQLALLLDLRGEQLLKLFEKITG
jgi:hypothetical protein